MAPWSLPSRAGVGKGLHAEPGQLFLLGPDDWIGVVA